MSTTHVIDTHHLRLWYGIYRIIVASGLFISLSIPLYQKITTPYQIESAYVLALLFYFTLTIVQLITVLYTEKTVKYTAIFFSAFDLVTFNIIILLPNRENINVSLLFAVTLFISNAVLNKKMALLITLVSMSCVIYSPFINHWFNKANSEHISNGFILAFVFFTIYIIARYLSKHFNTLEKVNLSQKIELNKLHDLNQHLLEQIDMGYILLNHQYDVSLINPAAYQLLNQFPSAVDQTQHLSVLHQKLYNTLKEKKWQHTRFIFELSSTTTIKIEIQHLHIHGQRYTLLVMQDAKRIQQHAQQLKLAALGQLSASIAHEIRNPLACIVQANDLLLDSDTDQIRFMHEMIHKQSQRIDRIINATLHLAHAPSHQPTQVNLETLIESLFNDDLPDVKDQIHYTQTDVLYLLFDEVHLKQVLINLIRNAIRYNIKDGTKIELRVYTIQEKIIIDVIDFGKGVADEHLNTLFNPFFTTEQQGTGLGLYLSRSLCEANQAHLLYLRQQQATYFRIECSAL